MKRITFSFLVVMVAMTALAQQKSAKRGIGWDERGQKITNAPVEKMMPGIFWLYNWGATVQGTASKLGTADMQFAPMCWNGGYDAAAIRNYVKGHKNGVKYLLGFNEPNFSAQSNMTPSAAADKWTGVEALAEELGLKIVAPALNFTGEKVGGKVWSPYEWLDEFVKQYKSKNGRLPKIDCLALHCYMNWYGSSTWFTTEYFYKDLYDSGKKDVYGKYPNIVEMLDSYKAANGHFPRMMLTEFCSWEGDKDGFVTTKDSQIDQMTQKVQKLEQSDLVEGYAWFMGNAGSGYNSKPYMSLFQTNKANSELSDLGKVYVNMSSFDTEKYYAPGEQIQAKDYIDATTDATQVKLRPNTEAGSTLPLQVEMQSASYPTYQIDVPADGEYTFTLHLRADKGANVSVWDGKFNELGVADVTASSEWKDVEFKAKLKAGKQTLLVYNGGSDSFIFNAFSFSSVGDGIESVTSALQEGLSTVYDLNGRRIATVSSIKNLTLSSGVYVVVKPNGERMKIKM